MTTQPNNTFLKNLLKCSVEHTNANSKWNENDPEASWFQEYIYIPTLLDKNLLPDLLGLKYPLVFLAGTPGSGKTQFLKKVKDEFLKRGYEIVLPSDGQITVAKFQKDESVVYVKHDATQVENEIEDAAVKLSQLLEGDWSDSNFDKQEKNAAYIVGINQGVLQRLCDLDSFRKLSLAIKELSDQRILKVDLSKRSAVDPTDYGDAFVSYLILALTDQVHWEGAPTASVQTCQGCKLSENDLCPILANVKWLRKDSLIKRVHEVFELNHFIAGRVTTFRDVLAILSKFIGGYSGYFDPKEPCDCIREQVGRNDFTGFMNLSRLLIYNGAFSDQDPYAEFIGMGIPKASRIEQRFFGFAGSYFASGETTVGMLTMLDPALSDHESFRKLDDEIFNFPQSLFDAPKAPIEEAFFRLVRQELTNMEKGEQDADLATQTSQWKTREWLLYCLVRLGRRRAFFLEEASGRERSRYEHADSFIATILGLYKNPNEGRSRQVAGDLKRALTAFSGARDHGEMRISFKNRDSEIAAYLVFDIPLTVSIPSVDTQYVEYFPRELYVSLRDPDGHADRVTPLKVDLDVWECLRRAVAGFLPSFLGIERIKNIEAFLDGIRSFCWDFKNCRLEISRDEQRVEIKNEDGKLVIQ